MNDELRRCPNCNAYVMGNDTHCPRCDCDLRGAANAFDTAESEPAKTETFDTPPAGVYTSAEVINVTVTPVEQAQNAAAPATTPATETATETAAEAVAEIAPKTSADDVPGADAPPAPPPARPLKGAPRLITPVFETKTDAVVREPDARQTTRPGTDQLPKPVTASATDTPSEIVYADVAEMPTQAIVTGAQAEPAPDLHATQPRPQATHYILPPAPYTPPPEHIAPPPPAMIAPPNTSAPSYIPPEQRYAQPVQPMSSGDAAIAYVQQRVQAYRRGNYRIETHGQYEASLTYGKPLSVGTWLLALITGIGVFWYLLILTVSGFHADVVYIVLENDGRVYEDGPGAAHIRGKRARTGRRWSAVGLVIFVLSLILAIILGVGASVVLTQDRYQAALREAYPAVTLFENHFSAERADPGDVDLAKDVAVAFAVVSVITAVGLWGGATLFVIGTVHANAYRTRVPPLPGWA